MVVNGKIAANDSRLRIQLPPSFFRPGKLHVKFLRFFYCDNEAHTHHFDQPETTPYPPAVRAYQARIAVRPQPPYLLRQGSTDTGQLHVRPVEPSNNYYLPKLPVRRTSAFATVMLSGDAAVQPAPVVAPPPPPAAAAGPIGGNDGYVNSDSEDYDDNDWNVESAKRWKRADDDGPLSQHDIRLTLGFAPSGTPIKAPDELTDIDIRTASLPDIVFQLSQCFLVWNAALGKVHSTPASIVLRELNDEEIIQLLPEQQASAPDYAIVVLTLPPGIGLALRTLENFLLLELPVDRLERVGKKNPLQGVPEGFRYLFGTSDSGTSTVYVSERPILRAATGLELMVQQNKRRHVAYKVIPDKMLTLQPRFVHAVRSVSFVSNLQTYLPSHRLFQRYVHLEALSQVLCEAGHEILGIVKRAITFLPPAVVDGAALPEIIPNFAADGSHADFYMEAEFGSADLASWFGLRETVFRWSADRNNAEEEYIRNTERAQFTEAALSSVLDVDTGARVEDLVVAPDESVALLSLKLGHIRQDSIRWKSDGAIPDYLKEAKEAFSNAYPNIAADFFPQPAVAQGGEGDPAAAIDVPEQQPAPEGAPGPAPQPQIPAAINPQPLILVANPRPAPAATFVHLQRRTESRCTRTDDFPEKFYLLSEEGIRDDYFDDLGEVCIAGSFVSKGEADSNVTSSGFVLHHWTPTSTSLEFLVYSWDLQLFKNVTGRDGFVRCTLAVSPYPQSAKH